MTAQLAVEGLTVAWWEPVPDAPVPAGLVIDHGDHDCLVPWIPEFDGVPVEPFTLEALVPLTVSERVRCGTCRQTGWIQQGAWLPVDGGS